MTLKATIESLFCCTKLCWFIQSKPISGFVGLPAEPTQPKVGFLFISLITLKMRSIKANFKRIQIKNPNLGDFICLSKAVISKRFSRKNLVKAFKELIPKADYQNSETKELIDHLEILTNLIEEVEK